MHIPGISLY